MQNEASESNDNSQNPGFVAGEFIIKFTEYNLISGLTINILNHKHGVQTIEKVFDNAENTILDNIYKCYISEDADILEIVQDYKKLPNVIYAEPNGIARPFIIPNDPDFNKQWYLDNTGQYNGRSDSDVDAPEAWDIIKGSSDIIIAIVDSGIDYTHPDIADNIWTNVDELSDNDIDDDRNGYVDDIIGWDFAYDDNDPKDMHGHGTVCAGVAGAVTDNNIGIAGVSWNSKVMSVQISNETWVGTFTDISQGIKYAADNDASIISLSFGWHDKNDNIVKNACDYAYNKGVLIVAAAGNSNSNLEHNPAAFENVVAVAGTDNNDSRMEFTVDDITYASNYGRWVDIAAPGEHIYTTMPTYNVTMNNKYGDNLNYEFQSGTSLSGPIVAGIAALMLSKNGTLTPDKVKSIMLRYVEPYRSLQYLGTGRINAYKATEDMLAFNNDWNRWLNTPEITMPFVFNYLILEILTQFLRSMSQI